MGQTQAQLSRLENGPGLRDLDRLVAWAVLLGMPTDMLWFSLPEKAVSRTEPELVGVALPFVRALRVADRQVGGAHLYSTVATCLAQYTPSSFAREDTNVAARPAVASFAEMAGWMALDGGARRAARRHLVHAATLASASDDTQLFAQTHASLSYLSRREGNAAEALVHIQTGLQHFRRGPSHGPLEARLLAMLACGLAAAGDAVEATAVMADAQRAFERESGTASPWLSPFDAASLASEVAWCSLKVGDNARAIRHLREALAQRKPDRVRSRAFAQLMLAMALLGQGRPDEACVLVLEVLECTANLGSAVLLEQLRHVHVLLQSHVNSCSDVPDVVARLTESIRDRAWIGAAAALHEASIGS